MKLSKSRISEIIQEEIYKHDNHKKASILEAPDDTSGEATQITAQDRVEQAAVSTQWSFISLVLQDPSMFENFKNMLKLGN